MIEPQRDREREERGRPAGIDRARENPGRRPPVPLRSKGSGSSAAPPEPEFPSDATIDLPRAVKHELRNQVRGGRELLDQVMSALTIGGDAIDDGRPDVAMTYLEWAKHHAPRSSAIREALGIAYYHAERYAAATTELHAYKRMTGHRDQNHVLADCARATGGDTAHIGELVEQMDPGRDGPERYAEGMIVWASALAERGDIGAGRAVLRRVVDASTAGTPEEHDLRLWYVAGDLAERAHDQTEARRWFARVAKHADQYFDVEERLARLSPRA